MRQAYKSRTPKTAKRRLQNLARSLQNEHPGAAASLREGLDDTLTVMGLGLSKTLERSFATTNPIENFNGGVRHITRLVKRWRGGTMVLRWIAAAVGEPSRASAVSRATGTCPPSLLLSASTTARSVSRRTPNLTSRIFCAVGTKGTRGAAPS